MTTTHQPAGNAPDRPRCTVLLIDDDSGSRMVVSQLLAAEGHTIVEAPSGEEGLALAATVRPDIVILDVMMPGLDGNETCRRLRADPTLSTIPVLMLTTLDDRDSRLRGLESGADDFLCKPVDAAELRTRLRTIARLNRFRLVHEESEQRRRLEAQLLQFQRLELMGQFAGGIVHDFNNVLSPILSGCQMLAERMPTEEDREMLEHVENAARRGVELVQQLLMFARGGSGKPMTVDLFELLDEVASMLRSALPRSIRLELDIAEELPPVVADRAQLHQIMMNLAVNARDAMPQGGFVRIGAHVIDVSAEQAAAQNPPVTAGAYVALTVADTGAGIPRELKAKIFEPFFTTKASGKGTGLGLATVQRLVRAHHGFIEVDSVVDVGTKFRCCLPVAEVVVAPAAPASPAKT